ncbi:hypothetical protein B0H13DRAFT_1867093 [Mycena leptocephala]|nr:hypothetical protein B0H13DRAFT_1867093 [Mycena leptocephala]
MRQSTADLRQFKNITASVKHWTGKLRARSPWSSKPKMEHPKSQRTLKIQYIPPFNLPTGYSENGQRLTNFGGSGGSTPGHHSEEEVGKFGGVVDDDRREHGEKHLETGDTPCDDPSNVLAQSVQNSQSASISNFEIVVRTYGCPSQYMLSACNQPSAGDLPSANPFLQPPWHRNNSQSVNTPSSTGVQMSQRPELNSQSANPPLLMEHSSEPRQRRPHVEEIPDEDDPPSHRSDVPDPEPNDPEANEIRRPNRKSRRAQVARSKNNTKAEIRFGPINMKGYGNPGTHHKKNKWNHVNQVAEAASQSY